MNMIEKVAQAITDNITAGLPDGVTIDARYAAVAAIEALRVPTDTMAKAGEDEAIACSCAECCSQAYTAMIDSALEGQ